MRQNIYDILKSSDIDLMREYQRIYIMFYQKPYGDHYSKDSLYKYISDQFMYLDKTLIHRCLNFYDFDETYGYNFDAIPNEVDLDYLISFSEYVYNFVNAYLRTGRCAFNENYLIELMNHINECMEDVGFHGVEYERITIFVEKNPSSIAVAEISSEDLAYSVLEYNHYKLKGDLGAKKIILKKMADDIESKRSDLNGINKSFSDNLFQLLNKFIRHDNSNNAYINNMNEEELEKVYDEMYQMWLLAKLQLEYYQQKDYISEIISSINS